MNTTKSNNKNEGGIYESKIGLKKKYIDFFVSKDHKQIDSSSFTLIFHTMIVPL